MSCDGKLASCGPVVARWSHRNGNISRLCQACLDHWLDNADDDPDLEPASWSWLPKPGVWKLNSFVMLADLPHVAEAIRDIRRKGGPVARVIHRGPGA